MQTATNTLERKIKIARGPSFSRLEIEIEIRDTDKGAELSMCGAEYGTRGYMNAGGQLRDYVRELLDKPKRCGWVWLYDARDIRRLLAIGDRWHLNGMKAGCEHQRAEKWNEKPIDPSKPTDAYGRHFPGQKQDSWNMLVWIRRDEHPQGLLSYPCPTCGYKYGTAWLHEPLPESVIAELKAWPEAL